MQANICASHLRQPAPATGVLLRLYLVGVKGAQASRLTIHYHIHYLVADTTSNRVASKAHVGGGGGSHERDMMALRVPVQRALARVEVAVRREAPRRPA